MWSTALLAVFGALVLAGSGGVDSGEERVLAYAAPAPSELGSTDLFVARADGTDAVPLIAGPAGDSEPAWSPDGSRIAFVRRTGPNFWSATNLWIADANGGNGRPLTGFRRDHYEVVSPTWSPDGSRIAYCLFAPGARRWQVWVSRAGTRSAARLADIGCTGLAWSPDGRRIAVGFRRTLMELSSTGRPIRVLLRVPRFVIYGVDEQIYRVAWSPDGTWFALGSLKGLYVARSNGTGLRLRVSGHAAGAEGITWSPDGKTIVIHYGNGLLAVPFPKGVLRELPVNGSRPSWRR